MKGAKRDMEIILMVFLKEILFRAIWSLWDKNVMVLVWLFEFYNLLCMVVVVSFRLTVVKACIICGQLHLVVCKTNL